jgi:hypothetical protein
MEVVSHDGVRVQEPAETIASLTQHGLERPGRSRRFEDRATVIAAVDHVVECPFVLQA